MAYRWKLSLSLLLLLNALFWLAVFSFPNRALHLIACDVSQGDAFLITQGQTQILIDGGPNNQVLDCLSRHLPFWDRRLELVILTHPESDHYQGLIEVFRRYQVDYLLASALVNPAQSYQVFQEAVGESYAQLLDPTSHSQLKLGNLSLTVLWPTAAFLAQHPAPSAFNDFSIVTRFSFYDFDALFTGDLNPKNTSLVIDQLALSEVERVEYLKVPHHGSKNGLTPELLNATSPQYGIISVGKNPWGHPHQEVLDMLSAANVQILRTDQLGDIELITNGQNTWLKN